MNVNQDSDRIKSAYEKAMERAEEMIDDTEDSISYERREEIKPILGKFFREEIASEDLWQKFEEYNEKDLKTAQKMIIDSLGLNSSDSEIEKRKQGLLALEDLKENSRVSVVERVMDNVSRVVDQYNTEQERLRDKLENMLRKHMQQQQQSGQMNASGNPMQVVQHLDEDTRRRIARTREQMEEKFQQQWEEVREELEDALGLE